MVRTAGQIDHGKTALIHALTGVATDRPPNYSFSHHTSASAAR
jgi:selenocysteine-specific translation elongation factor